MPTVEKKTDAAKNMYDQKKNYTQEEEQDVQPLESRNRLTNAIKGYINVWSMFNMHIDHFNWLEVDV